MNSPWLAGPGQFWILGVGWVSSVIIFTVVALKLGKAIRSESDGCLLAISNFLLTIVGGMGGLALLRFPYNIFSSLFLCLLLPSVLTQIWIRRTDPRKRS